MKIKRNTLAVRLNDHDYDRFLSIAGKNYSLTLRKMIQIFNENHRPEDKDLSFDEKIKKVLKR